MVRSALPAVPLDDIDVLIVENVGNLVCPAEFRIGEDARIMVCSVTEGEDKPLKYPLMFRACELVVINKVDLLKHLDFDVDRLEANIKQVNHDATVMRVSAKTGEGVDEFRAWLKALPARVAAAHDHPHGHDHPHDHDHEHPHDHHHRRDHGHGGGHHHHHAPPEGSGWRGLVAVGISGGLLPCPSALVVLLAAISLHRVGYGLVLIVAFSIGLAATITGIGLLAIGARRLFARTSFDGPLVRILPAASALVILGVGIAMTVRALPGVS
jgi:hypothetical protein